MGLGEGTQLAVAAVAAMERRDSSVIRKPCLRWGGPLPLIPASNLSLPSEASEQLIEGTALVQQDG